MLRDDLGPPKEMISEDLHGVLPEDEVLTAYQETFISTVLVTPNPDESLMGSLVGVELSAATKIDLKSQTSDAFDFLSNIAVGNIPTISMVILNYGDKITKIAGPFAATSVKIVDLDATNKTCVLAVDLIKEQQRSR